jgi:hypothetical protein
MALRTCQAGLMSELRYVAKDYRHFPKVITACERLNTGHAQLKWYNLARAEDGVPQSIERMARAFLTAEAKAERVGVDRELGFVVLHRCDSDFYFLLLSTWRGSNELWETIFYKENSAMPGFAEFKFDSRHRGTFCVWELGAVGHEQKAWARFLSSERTLRDEEHYLGETFAGSV